ncbi:MAG TPA: LOG family protein, partial [Pyrinomonadaceae bacterium]|nr:LOG family protein [Pyrinomonadaceae bacterium]
REKGGRVFGIVMNQFKSEPNRYLTDKVATDHFYDRLQNLITRSVGFVAFRGGMGTVTEISLVWNKLQTRVLERRPLVLIGECWKQVVDCWKQELVVSDSDVSYLDFAENAEEACRMIVEKSQGVRV